MVDGITVLDTLIALVYEIRQTPRSDHPIVEQVTPTAYSDDATT